MSNPSQNGWDWPYILYVGRRWLGYTDDQVWSLTPRQLESQLKVHKDIMHQMYGGKASPMLPISDTGYIDQIPGW